MAGVKGRSGGKNRKSTRWHEVNGSYRQDRHGPPTSFRDAETDVPPARCPKWLPATAKRYWKDLGPKATERGLLDALTQTHFALLCRALAEVEELSKFTNANGPTYTAADGRERIHPNYRQLQRASRTLLSLGSEWGITPFARTTMGLTAPK